MMLDDFAHPRHPRVLGHYGQFAELVLRSGEHPSVSIVFLSWYAWSLYLYTWR
ncbi:MAG: hypothetical protein MZU97_20355 [Bacillus subtilis]|nr:hypothetical protein [Bacillus subtilis]